MTSKPNKAEIDRFVADMEERAPVEEADIRNMMDEEAKSEAKRQDMADEATRIEQHAIYFDSKTFHKNHCVPKMEDFYNDKERPILKDLRNWLVNDSKEHFLSLNAGNDLFIYRDGYYTKGVEGYVRTLLEVSAGGVNVKKGFVTDVMYSIGSSAIADECRVEDEWGDHTVLNNVVLNTKTLEITPHTPDLYTFSKLRCDYVEGAKCPKWEDFLKYTLPADEIKTLQEMFGYTLVRGYPYHVAFFLLGKGGNGKGAATQILRAMLGKGMTSAVPMQHVGNRFFASDLPNKYANISGDTSSEALYDASMFKMLTGGDDVRTEQKGRDAFDFRNYAKIISSMNELMKTSDQSDGFFRRFVLIRFDTEITEGRMDEKRGFEQEIIDAEMPGVLNWAIEGLKRVRAQGGFSFQTGKSKAELRKIWVHESDRVQMFIDETCEYGIGKCVAKTVFAKAYGNWHEERFKFSPKEEGADITRAANKYRFTAGTKNTNQSNQILWMNGDRYISNVGVYKGICLKNTPGNLDVDIMYMSDHWDEITAGDN